MKRAKGQDSQDSLRCSFCHKSQEQVRTLTSNPSDYPRAYICDECVVVCHAILEEQRASQDASESNKVLVPSLLLEDYLAEYVEDAATRKKLVALIISHLDSTKATIPPESSHILVLGPTDTANCRLAQAIADILDLPMAVVDVGAPIAGWAED